MKVLFLYWCRAQSKIQPVAQREQPKVKQNRRQFQNPSLLSRYLVYSVVEKGFLEILSSTYSLCFYPFT